MKTISTPAELLSLFAAYRQQQKSRPVTARQAHKLTAWPLTVVSFKAWLARLDYDNIAALFENRGKAYQEFVNACNDIKKECLKDIEASYNPLKQAV